MEPMETPSIPWHTLGTDLFYHDGNSYLIIADYFSKYPVVELLSEQSSQSVANVTVKAFSLFGVPNTIVSDNGPQFIGKSYQDLMKKFGISHVTSSPYHPRGHGFIERQIRTVKNVIKKSPQDTELALMSLRNTPKGTDVPSPAELLFGRKLQTLLPAYKKPVASESLVIKRNAQMQDMQNRYDAHTKALPELSVNTPVFYQDVAKRTWSPGKIMGYGPEPRSYTIQCDTTGQMLRRNRIFLRSRKVTFSDLVKPVTVRAPEVLRNNVDTQKPSSEEAVRRNGNDAKGNDKSEVRGSVPNKVNASVHRGTVFTQSVMPDKPAQISPHRGGLKVANVPVPQQQTRTGRVIVPPRRLVEEA